MNDGYYVFLEYDDIVGPTVLKIYDNDKNLINDVKKNYEVAELDYKLKFCKNDRVLIQKCINAINKYGVAIRDMTGIFLEPGFYPVDEALELMNNLNIWER